jgi:hypothetical protein
VWHASAVELELRRAGEDRRLYTVDGVGTLRFAGFLSRSATAEGDGRRWHIGKRGFWRSLTRQRTSRALSLASSSRASSAGAGCFAGTVGN